MSLLMAWRPVATLIVSSGPLVAAGDALGEAVGDVLGCGEAEGVAEACAVGVAVALAVAGAVGPAGSGPDVEVLPPPPHAQASATNTSSKPSRGNLRITFSIGSLTAGPEYPRAGSGKDVSVATQPLTYGSYLRVEDLLDLQHPLSDPPHHDEMLFIVIHQVYELWFKQILHELDSVVRFMDRDDLLRVGKAFHRIHAIQRILESQVDVLETMTPQDFNAFREGLNPASGFQSAQFREIEFLGGLRGNEAYLRHLAPTAPERERLERRLREPTLYDALKAYLQRHGFDVSSHDALVAAFRTVYENEAAHYTLYLLLEELIDFDEKFALWRGRHVLMVERMIGMKTGTGGSMGVAYLQTTLSRRFFPELWEVRTELGTRPRA
jgi:tryptophan 2,3-dioxygenase